jgi:hypothetical protein
LEEDEKEKNGNGGNSFVSFCMARGNFKNTSGMAEEIKSVAQVEKEKKAAAKKISTAQPSETEAKERDRETCRSVGSAATRLVQHQVEKEREKLPRPPASQPGDVGQACMCGEEDLSMALVAPAGAAAGRRR